MQKKKKPFDIHSDLVRGVEKGGYEGQNPPRFGPNYYFFVIITQILTKCLRVNLLLECKNNYSKVFCLYIISVPQFFTVAPVPVCLRKVFQLYLLKLFNALENFS